MKSIEYLLQLHPDKTGREILAIQAEEKLEDERKFEKANAKKLKFVIDHNTNGGYYCGRFGVDQRYFYRVFNMRMEGSDIYMDVETIVVFMNDADSESTRNKGEVNVERRIKEFQKEDKYCLNSEMRNRVTKKEWDEVNDYVNNLAKFWEHIKKV